VEGLHGANPEVKLLAPDLDLVCPAWTKNQPWVRMYILLLSRCASSEEIFGFWRFAGHNAAFEETDEETQSKKRD
jgi:hypothetical protein